MDGLDLRVLFTYRLLVEAGYLDDDLFAADEALSGRPPGRIRVDAQLCIGCHACRTACPVSAIRIWESLARVTNPIACLSCADTPCVPSCPTGAVSETDSFPRRQ